MNKRGSMFIFLLTVIFVLAILPALWFSVHAKSSRFEKAIGEKQATLMNIYEKGEMPLFYIDESAKQSYRSALLELSGKGFLQDPGCGSYNGYVLLNSETEECYPDIKEEFKKSFGSRFPGYLSQFKEEIPELEYEFYLSGGREGSEIIGVASESLRIDITEEDAYNFKASEFAAKPRESEGNEEDIPSAGQDDEGNFIPSGKCGYIAEYASRYIGCPYSLDIIALQTPETCGQTGLTCATFVGSVIAYTLGYGEYPYGHGRQKCDSATVTKIGVDPNRLQPGDIFASEYRRRDGTYTPWGHTGMYVGRGFVSQPDGIWCFRQFTQDNKGEHVFIHSMGSSNFGKPGVCYDTYSHLFVNQPIVLTSFCRPNKCL